MNKHRINIISKQNSKLIHKNNIDSCLEHLSIAMAALYLISVSPLYSTLSKNAVAQPVKLSMASKDKIVFIKLFSHLTHDYQILVALIGLFVDV